MMDWTGVASLLLAAGRAVYEYGWATPAADAERERHQREILDAIRTSSQILLTTLADLEIGELESEMRGFFQIYDTYDPEPGDSVEEGRLERLASDSARVIERLMEHVTRLPDPDTDMDSDQSAILVSMALEAAAIVLPLTFLRVQAMIEREITYGAEEISDAQRFLGGMVDRLSPVLPNLRVRSDRRFGELYIYQDPEPGSKLEYWVYNFNGRRAPFIWLTRSHDGRERAAQHRAAHMAGEFLRFENGAAPVLSEAISIMEGIRDSPPRPTKPETRPERPVIDIDHGGVFRRAERR